MAKLTKDKWGNVRNPIREVGPGSWIRTDGSAEAVRYTEGPWRGWWIVRAIVDKSHSDPISTKIVALETLRIWGATTP